MLAMQAFVNEVYAEEMAQGKPVPEVSDDVYGEQVVRLHDSDLFSLIVIGHTFGHIDLKIWGEGSHVPLSTTEAVVLGRHLQKAALISERCTQLQPDGA